MRSYSVAEAKTHLSEILEKILEGEEVILTRRGQPVARLIPVERTANILGMGVSDPNMNHDVVAADQWWRHAEETDVWYE